MYASTIGLMGTNGVGIGTTAPTSILNIACNTNTSQSAAPDGGANHGILLTSSKSGSTPYSMAFGVDYSTGYGYLNAAGNALTQPILLQSRGGNVGIGTTNPGSLLTICGIGSTASANTTVLLDTSASVTTAGGQIGILNFSNNGVIGAAIQCSLDVGGVNNNGALLFHTRTDYVTYNERMRITRAGNIGIGTNSPLNNFEIYNNGGVGGTTQANITSWAGGATTTNTAALNLRVQGAGGGSVDNIISGQYNSSGAGNYSIALKPGGTTTMTVVGNGNVGIGITNPNAALHVNGTISVNGGTLCARASNYIASGGSYTRTVTLGGGDTGGALEVTITGYGVSGGGWAIYKIIIYGNMPSSSGFNLSSTTVLSNTYGYAQIFTVSSVNNPSSGSYTIVLTISSPGTIFLNAMVVSIGSTLATISIS